MSETIARRRLVRNAPKGSASPSGSPEDGAETFLIEMLVVGENFGQPFTAHGLH